MKRPGYMMIKEAAARYQVSRAKLHRLVQLGRLRTSRDPRDERVTLVRIEDVEALFRFPPEEGDMVYDTGTGNMTEATGRLSQEWRDRIDGLRMRMFAEKGTRFDSVEIIREQREKRARDVHEAAFGQSEEGDGRDA